MGSPLSRTDERARNDLRTGKQKVFVQKHSVRHMLLTPSDEVMWKGRAGYVTPRLNTMERNASLVLVRHEEYREK
jgi:hypothetical protein